MDNRNRATPGDRLPARGQERSLQPQGERELREKCPACAAAVLQELTFTMKNGDTAQLRKCTKCEWKSWLCNGEPAALADVLDAVQRTGLPYGRR
jgi:hypothetical protein